MFIIFHIQSSGRRVLGQFKKCPLWLHYLNSPATQLTGLIQEEVLKRQELKRRI